jgi:hypothetical protein
MIIRGFLLAMASSEADYATARQFLTQEASQAWSPVTSPTLIYASGTTPRVSGNQVTMSGAVVGYLHADGSFSGSSEPTWTHDFGVVRENDQWRISNPLPGLALSQYLFIQNFPRVNVYFFPSSGSVLVPDPRYIPRTDQTTTAQLVIDGPSQWLGGIVDASARDGLALSEDVTLTASGVAEVHLNEVVETLDLEEASRLAIELAATMRDITGVRSVRLWSPNGAVTLLGAASDGSMPVSAVPAHDSTPTGSQSALLMARDGVLSTVQDMLASVTPVNGDWGTTQRDVSAIAWHGAQSKIAAVTADGLTVGSAGGTPPQLIDSESSWLRPQFDLQGNLWVLRVADDGPLVSIITSDGAVKQIDGSGLSDMDISRFSISPDGRRMLLVRQSGTTDAPVTELGVALISYDDQSDQPTAIVSWKPIRLAWEGGTLKSLVDIAWLGPSSLLVLGSPGAGNTPGLFLSDLDGLTMEEWGLPQSWQPVELATHITTANPQVVVRDADGTLWSYEEGFQWSHFGERVTAVAFPS